VPRRVTAVDALPRTATGKLRRGALRGWSDAAPAG
jgi:acyl-coenzyme A synthetase/AMP-(fatty) acid ligase